MVRDILIQQKREFERKLTETYINRVAKLKSVESELIKVITGPRRSGKSFFAIHNSTFKKICYINFDDEKLVELKNLDELIDTAKEIYKNPEIWIMDEIQNLKKWELFVNRLQRRGLNLIITGSNSNLLSKELASHLTGRYTATTIFPFSFYEYILAFDELTNSEKASKFLTYMNKGGFPETVLKDIDTRDYLKTLFESVVYKDVIKRYKIRLAGSISDIADYLISNIAGEYSYQTLSKMTEIKSITTVQRYVGYLEEAFLFFKVNKFSHKKRLQISSNKKIYCIDNGFINSLYSGASPGHGKLFENLVAIELYRHSLNGEFDLFYWKNPKGEEIDFVIKKGRKIETLIQVCYDLNDQKTYNREVRSLVKASKELNCKNLLLINLDKEATEKLTWNNITANVKFIPAWKWLESDSFALSFLLSR